MAEKKITVVIDGQEFVSKAADDASAGMDRFSKKQPGWINGLADLKAGWEFLSKGIGFVRSAIEESLSAYDALVLSQRKMEGASKLTGLSLDYLHGIAAEAREKFGLSRVVANEYAVEMGKLEKASGGTAKATELLSGFLEIGAARGLTAAESLQAASQAQLGIDEGTDRLFGKNPSGLWADYESVIGKSAGKFSDMEKQAALAYAVIQGGNATLGSYAAVLESTAGKTEMFRQKNQEAYAALGESMTVIRERLVNVGGTTVPWFLDAWRRNFDGITSVIYNAENTLDRWMLAIYKVVGTDKQIAEYTEKSRVSFDKMKLYYDRSKMSAEELAKENAKVTGSLKDVIPQAATATGAFGGLIQPLGASTFAAKETAEAIGSIGPRAGMTAKEIESYGKMHVKTAAEVKDETKKAEEAWKQYLKEYEAGIKRLNEAYESYLKLLPKLQPALKQSMETVHIDGMNRALATSKDAADAAMKALKDGAGPLPPLVKKVEDSVRDMGTKLGDASDAVLLVGENFGVLDEDAKKVLGSVKLIGVSMGDLAKSGLSFAGVTGLIGGVASIVGTMMQADAERRQLTRENNTNLKRLTQEIGGLKLDITGEQYTSALAAFAPVADKLMRGEKLTVPEHAETLGRLSAAGLTMPMLVKIAKELGVATSGSGASETVVDIGALFRAMNVTNIGKVGTNFADQLAFFRESQDLNNESGPGKFQRLVEFLITKGGVGALAGVDFSDPRKARQTLLGLFSSLNEGGVAASMLGKISGGTLKDIIAEIIRGLGDNVPVAGGDAPSGGTPVGGGTSSITSGGVTVPTKTLSDVLDGVVAQTTALAAYHVQHLDLATAHLNEAKTQTVILSDIADSVRPLRDGGITSIADRGLEAERLSLAAERGIGASF